MLKPLASSAQQAAICQGDIDIDFVGSETWTPTLKTTKEFNGSCTLECCVWL